MSSLITVDQFNGDLRTARTSFRSWKRACWWRIVRVRKAQAFVRNWSVRAKNSVQGKQNAQEALVFFQNNAVRRSVASWRSNTGRLETVRCRALSALADSFFSARSSRRGFKTLKAFAKAFASRRSILRLAASKLRRVYTVTVLLRETFLALRAHADSLAQKHAGPCSLVFKKLALRVARSRRARRLHEEAWDLSERKALARGFKYLRKFATFKRDFKARICAALQGNELSRKRSVFGRWVRFKTDAANELEEHTDLAAKHRRRTVLSAVFNVVRVVYLRGLALSAAEHGFRVYKAKAALTIFRRFVLQQKTIRAFGRAQERRSSSLLLRRAMAGLKTRLATKRVAEAVAARQALAVQRVHFSVLKVVHASLRFARVRRAAFVASVFASWLKLAAAERKQRRNLTDLSRKYSRHRVLRAAKTFAMAKAYFASRCGWSLVHLCFGSWRKDARRRKEGRGKMVEECGKVLLRRKLRAWKAWVFVAERVAWQTACLRASSQNKQRRCFENWRDFILQEAGDRLVCEMGDREYAGLKLAEAMRKLRNGASRRSAARRDMEIGAEHFSRKAKEKGLRAIVNNCILCLSVRKMVDKAQRHYETARKRAGLRRLRIEMSTRHVRRVQRMASVLMSLKRCLVITLRAWKQETERQVGLRAGVLAGLSLMKVLAWKRWKSGVLHMKMRGKFLRSFLDRWRLFVDLRLRALGQGIKRRFFGHFKDGSEKRRRRREKCEAAFGLVQREKKRAVWRDWKLLRKGVEFQLTRTIKWKKERALYWLKERGRCFGESRRLWERWWTTSRQKKEGGKWSNRSVAAVIWRLGLGSFVLGRPWRIKGAEEEEEEEGMNWARGGKREGVVWAGKSVGLQLCYFAFRGLKAWLKVTKEEGRLNAIGLNFWRKALLAKVTRAWRKVRAERITEERRNESALGFWYGTRTRGVMAHWIKRTAYFKKCRLEVQWNQQRAGFENFVGGVVRLRMRKRQGEAAVELCRAREVRLVRMMVRAWNDLCVFEKKDRLLRKMRAKRVALARETFVAWRMTVKGIKMTRLVYQHHESRFNESVEIDAKAAVQRGE